MRPSAEARQPRAGGRRASPFSDEAEVFRELRSQLLMGVLRPDQPRRALAVVSPNVGDGKTYLAANMAIAFSQLGGRTLLVDADMRTPRQQDCSASATGPGLSSVLSGRAEHERDPTVADLPSLYVLPVGTCRRTRWSWCSGRRSAC